MPPSGIGTGLCKSPGAKGGASTTLYPPAGRPPDHAPHLCKTAQRADSESRAWKASLLCTVPAHLDVRKWPPTMWGMVRATARVPTPLHTTPALTMIRHHVIPLVVIVRAGVVWSGVGTLAVALVVGLLLHHQ